MNLPLSLIHIYYPINEEAAKRAKDMNSFSDYQPGSATTRYRAMVNEAYAAAERQKARVDPMYHDTIEDVYKRQEALCALPVAALAAPDSALFLWATFPQLPEALRLIEA